MIGDIGGHLRVLRHVLSRLGGDLDCAVLPAELTVIQVGDLIGGGPLDDAVVDEVQRWISNNPGRWIQLIGNWEARHLGGPVFEHPRRTCPLSPRGIATLTSWWRSGAMTMAVTVKTGLGAEALVTHAGATSHFWHNHLDADPDPATCARSLNQIAHDRPACAFHPGRLLADPLATRLPLPGPVWAMEGPELWASWIGDDLPFHQVHGHSSAYYFGGCRWNGGTSERVRQLAQLQPNRRHLWWQHPGGKRIVGIDPGLGQRPRLDDLTPLTLQRAMVDWNERGSLAN